jgi:hypothetical protein
MLICPVIQVLCIQGFLTCRKHAERIILLVEMLQVIWMLVPYVLWSSNMQSACVFCIVVNCTCRFSEQYGVADIMLHSSNLLQTVYWLKIFHYFYIDHAVLHALCLCCMIFFSLLDAHIFVQRATSCIIFVEKSAKEENIYMSESMS